jgi:hypothetical protein
METIQLDLYGFAELRDKALAEFADINVYDDWYAFIMDDFKSVCETIGITVDTKNTYFRLLFTRGRQLL